MKLEDYIGKKEKVKILRILDDEKYYVGQIVDKDIEVYIENDGDYEKEEVIGFSFECLIINIVSEKLVGFILTDRKFINDIKKIEEKLKKTDEYKLVKDIYLMERLKIKGKVVGLYMVDEGDIGKYYLETIEIGTYLKKTRENNIIFKEKTVTEELKKQIRDVVSSIDLSKKEISLNEEEDRQIDMIRKTLGVESEIIGLAILDLDQIVQNRDELLEEQEEIKDMNEEKQKQVEDNLQRIQNKKKELGTVKDVDIKQETRLKGFVTDYKTLGQLLDKNGKLPKVPGKKFDRMGVIHTSEKNKLVNEKGEKARTSTTKYSFVAIARDGTVVPLDLEQDRQEGRNPMERNYQVNQKGEVIQDDITSRYRIGAGTFAVKNGQFGEIEIYHSPRKTIGGPGIEGNKSLDVQLESNNVWRLNKDERDLAAEYRTGYKSVQRGYEEAKEHEDKSGEIMKDDKVRTEDVDGNKNTKSHIHDDINFEYVASKWGYYKDGKPNAERAKEIFEEKVKENPNKNKEEIIEMVEDEIDQELRRTHHTREER